MTSPQDKKIDNESQLPDIRQEIKRVVNQYGQNLTKEEKIKYAQMFKRMYEDGLNPCDAMGISRSEIATLYRYCFRLYAAGQYKEAKVLFEILTTLWVDNAGLHTCLGVCHHKLKDFDKAIESYMAATYFDLEDPVPFFYAYDCFMNLKEEKAALVMLKNAIERSGDRKPYAMLKQRATLLAENLKTHLDAAEKEEKAKT